MSQVRICTLCKQPLNTRPFWDNLRLHKDCLETTLNAVTITVTQDGVTKTVSLKETV